MAVVVVLVALAVAGASDVEGVPVAAAPVEVEPIQVLQGLLGLQ
jgi:hypothetical protein